MTLIDYIDLLICMSRIRYTKNCFITFLNLGFHGAQTHAKFVPWKLYY